MTKIETKMKSKYNMNKDELIDYAGSLEAKLNKVLNKLSEHSEEDVLKFEPDFFNIY